MFPSGLPLFWLMSNLIGIGTQYVVGGGWGNLKRSSTAATPATARAK
jgi:membrane protein insertase Oxa1/YidC/SpoIIIJ